MKVNVEGNIPFTKAYHPVFCADVLAKNTLESMQCGLFYGYVGMVESLIDRLRQELQIHTQPPPVIVVTGGWSGVIAPALSLSSHPIENLTLEGLHWIFQRNRAFL